MALCQAAAAASKAASYVLVVQAVRKLLEIWNKWIDKKMASRKTKSDVEREKVIQNRCQELLKRMIQDEDNKYCVDCDAKGKE